MMKTLKLVLIAGVLATGLATPSFAQGYPYGGLYNYRPYGLPNLGENDFPGATGGGSVGYNYYQPIDV